MENLTTNEKVQLVKQLVDDWQALSDNIDEVEGIIGIDLEAPFMESVFNMFENYIDRVAELVGDEADWIRWYIFENECGKNCYEAQVKMKSDDPNEEPIMKQIKKVKHLIALIEED